MTSDTQSPPTPTDAIAHWFDDVFRIYGDMVDSQRRLAVALIHAASPVLDVGERAGEKAAAGAERLSATAQRRTQVLGRGSAPARGQDSRNRDAGEQQDSGEDVRGDEPAASATVGQEAVDEHEDTGTGQGPGSDAVTTPDTAVTEDLDAAAPTVPEDPDGEADDTDLGGDEVPGIDAAEDGAGRGNGRDGNGRDETREGTAPTGQRDGQDERRPDEGGDRAERRRTAGTRRSSTASRTSGRRAPRS